MDLNFTKVKYDGELADFGEDELRELVGEFEEAQDSNVAEFERAVEQDADVDESIIEDFTEAREDLIGEISEAEAFGEVPLSADALEDCTFGELRDWQDFVAEEAEEDEATEDGEFSDMGKKSPVEEDEDEDFADDVLGEMPGLTL